MQNVAFRFLLGVLLCFLANHGYGQRTLQTVSRTRSFAIQSGAFISLQVGPQYSFLGELEKDLLTETALSTDSVEFNLNGLTTTFSVQAGVAVKRFVIRGQYARNSTTTSETLKGNVQLHSNLFGIQVGYLVYNQKRWLMYPYVGAVFGTTKMDIANFDKDDLMFGNSTVPILQTLTYEANTTQAELGASVRYMLDQNGGIIVGADLGGTFSLGDNPWNNPDGQAVESVAPHKLSSMYLRFSVGFGVFRD